MVIVHVMLCWSNGTTCQLTCCMLTNEPLFLIPSTVPIYALIQDHRHLQPVNWSFPFGKSTGRVRQSTSLVF